MFLTFTYFTFYGMVAVGLTPTQHMASVVSSAFYSLWNLLSGFLIPQSVRHYKTLFHSTFVFFFSVELFVNNLHRKGFT